MSKYSELAESLYRQFEPVSRHCDKQVRQGTEAGRQHGPAEE
jgi:hypothetical protein